MMSCLPTDELGVSRVGYNLSKVNKAANIAKEKKGTDSSAMHIIIFLLLSHSLTRGRDEGG